MDGVKLDRWGYEVRTSSDSCISAINAFYQQVCLSLSLFCFGLSYICCKSEILKWVLGLWTFIWNYTKVLIYGRGRSVILEAPFHDKDCVLANILAAHFLCSSDPSRAPSHLQAAKSCLVSLFVLFRNVPLFFASNRNFIIMHRRKPPRTRKQFSMPSVIWCLKIETTMSLSSYTLRYVSLFTNYWDKKVNLFTFLDSFFLFH